MSADSTTATSRETPPPNMQTAGGFLKAPDRAESTVDSAVAIWRAGQTPIPLRKGQKKPLQRNWPDTRYSDEDAVRRAFARPCNLGIRLGDGLADVDLDDAVAIAAADGLLPATGAVFGRASTPGSHRVYRLRDGGALPYTKHTDASGESLVELRADARHQTMIPPSAHPSGERIEWADGSRLEDAAEVDGAVLAAAVATVALVSALAPAWPGEGSRNDAFLALAGALLRGAPDDAGLVEAVERIIDTLAAHTHDDEAADRARQTIPATCRALSEGREATGWPRLRDLLQGDASGAVDAARRAAGHLREALGVPPEHADAAGAFDDVIGWGDAGQRSHMRIATRFVVFAAGRCRYFHGLGWHFWDGRRWALDAGDAYAHGILRDLVRECAPEALVDTALRSDLAAASARPESTLKDASRRPEILVTEADGDPYLINCANGTLDLRSMALRPADRADCITKVTRAAYDPAAPREAWDRFLEDVLPDPEVRGYLSRYVGVSLIGRVLEHVLMIAVGSGRNGKGVFAHAVQRALGDYAITATNDLLTTGRYGGASAGDLSARMQLRGARWAAMSELNVDDRLAPATMKTLTGGDPITAKLMGRDFVTFDPSHSLFMLTNYLPRVPAEDQAAWARIRVVPFDVSFQGREDKHLDERLALSIDAVLTWAIEGLADYQRRGERLDEPASVEGARRGYRDSNDLVKRFLSESCVLDEAAWVTRGAFVEAFNAWLLQMGERRWTSAAVAERIAAIPSIEERKRRGTRGWRGVDLLVDI